MNVIQIDPRAIAYIQRRSRKEGVSESRTIEKMIEMFTQMYEFGNIKSNELVWDEIEKHGYIEDRQQLRTGGENLC